MRNKGAALFILLFLPLFLGMISEEGTSSSNFFQYIGKVINFLILFGGLAYLLYKPLRRFLEKRSSDVEQNRKDAENTRKEAEARLKEVKAQLENIQEEVLQMKKEAEIAGQKEKMRILEETRKETARIKSITQAQIDMYVAAGIKELREYAAELAIERAEERIKKRLTAEAHSLLIDKSILKIKS